MTFTPGRLLFEEIVPPHLREDDDGSPIDAGRLKRILQVVAEKEPQSYRNISHRLLRLGADASNEVSASFGLEDLRSPVDKGAIIQKLRQQEAEIKKRTDLSPAQKNLERVKLYGKISSDLPESVFSAAMAKGSNLAKMVASGARGSKGQLNSNIGADGLMLDANSNPIPIPILNSYAEGLSPGEYFASAYGTRRGLLSTKLCCSGDTKVLMADFSERDIRDIKTGEWVIGATKDGKSLRVQVKNVFSNGIKECWRYVFRRLSSRLETVEVCATADHQLLARRRDWGADRHCAIETPTKTAAGKMTKTRHVLVPAEGGDFSGRLEHRALLLGLLLGDGCVTSKQNLLLSCADSLLLEDIKEYLATLNFEASRGESETSYSYVLKYIKWPEKKEGGVSGCPHKEWLRSINVIGKYAHEKEIHPEVWEWDNASVAQLLAGIYSTDGSIYQTTASNGGAGIGIALCLTSKPLLEQAKRLLEKRFGIYGSVVYRVPQETKEHAKRDQWHFNISHRHAVELFAQHIPLVGKKRLTLDLLRSQKAPSRHNEQYTFKFLRKELIGEIPTYDIEVDHPDHLFVLANGIISSNSVAESGYLSKQLAAAAHDLVISKHDCETNRGIPVKPDDNDSIGSVLAKPVAGFPAGTIITGRVLRQIRDNKLPSFAARSPLTCTASNGICAVCAGIREKNRFPRIMENVGLAAASSVGEPLSQGTLSEKHSGGVASSSGKAVSAFRQIDSLVQVPDVFPNAATIAKVDGEVTRIESAPQGGSYIFVGDEKHYVPKGRDIFVKKGLKLEAGDVLGSGTPNPAEIVRHKGIGEGRLYFVNALRKSMLDNKLPVDRRNLEILGRSLVNHVKVTNPEGLGGFLPDDVVEYDAIEHGLGGAPANTTKLAPQKALGGFLARPALHYSIGTRITPSVAKTLDENGETEIETTSEPLGFEPEMQRVADIPGFKTDWMSQFAGARIKQRFQKSVHSGDAVSDVHGTSYIPGLAKGTEFGKPPPGVIGY